MRKLRVYRLLEGKPLREVARGLRLPAYIVSAIERGEVEPSDRWVRRFEEVYGKQAAAELLAPVDVAEALGPTIAGPDGMSASVDRDLVAHLLQDKTLSFREIARRANCSDWSVRLIARSLESDDQEPSEPLSPGQWGVLAGIIAVVIGAMCFAAWRKPPLDGGMM